MLAHGLQGRVCGLLRPACGSVRAGRWSSGRPPASKTGPPAGAPGRRADGACPARRRQLPPALNAGLTRWRPGRLDGWRRDRRGLTARYRGSPRHLARSRMPVGHRGAPPYRKRRSPVTATQRPSRRKPVEGVVANRFRPCPFARRRACHLHGGNAPSRHVVGRETRCGERGPDASHRRTGLAFAAVGSLKREWAASATKREPPLASRIQARASGSRR